MKKVVLLSLSLMLILIPVVSYSLVDVEPKASKIVEPSTYEFDIAQLTQSPYLVKESIAQIKQEEIVLEQEIVPEKVIVKEVEEVLTIVKEEIPEGTKGLFEVTAYTAGFESTGKRKDDKEYGITASGAYVKDNHTISCPKSFPYGTKVYFPSLNHTYTCEDRGGRIKEGFIDIYIEDLDVANKFGRQKNVEAYVVKP